MVVVRPPKASVTLECGGQPVIAHSQTRAEGVAPAEAHAGGVQAGKRYADAETGMEVLCTKAGKGSLSIDGRAIAAAEAKKLPSSD